MNIYEFNISGEKFWICAKTTIEAIKVYSDHYDDDLSDFEDTDDILLLPADRWSTHHVTDEYGNLEQSFLEYMQAAKEPGVIASTLY